MIGRNLGELYYKGARNLLTNGKLVDTRNGDTLELIDQKMVLTNPTYLGLSDPS